MKMTSEYINIDKLKGVKFSDFSESRYQENCTTEDTEGHGGYIKPGSFYYFWRSFNLVTSNNQSSGSESDVAVLHFTDGIQ